MADNGKDERDLPPWVAGSENRDHELNPDLSEDQIATIARYGKERSFQDGEWVWHAGDRHAGLQLVLEGELEIVDTTGGDERIIITHDRGGYGGEIVTLAGRGAYVGGRAKGPSRIVCIGTDGLRRLMALEPELGEIILVSFIVRRMRMLANTLGSVRLHGVAEQAATANLRSFLSRHGVPLQMVHDEGDEKPIPRAVVGERELVRPTIRELAEAIGLAAQIDEGAHYDLAVMGGGPSGLAAAVYGASEGLSVLVVESFSPGGQAGTSSRIENYLGFPTGISGQGLAGRAFLQATKFGAEIANARDVQSVECGRPHSIALDGGTKVSADAVVVATGAVYREPPVKGLDRFKGGGVHYGASHIEAQLCRDTDVAIIGGGNSAGQAAVFLSRYVRSIRILVRNEGLASTMSSYLVDRIEEADNIEVMPHTETVEAKGDMTLERLVLEDRRTGERSELEVPHVFIFIGAVPASDFLPEEVQLDRNGFVCTGSDLKGENWPLDREPKRLETSCPGIFAVGDVRAGSVKRVASAVGEGSVCVSFVHEWLAELHAKEADAA